MLVILYFFNVGSERAAAQHDDAAVPLPREDAAAHRCARAGGSAAI